MRHEADHPSDCERTSPLLLSDTGLLVHGGRRVRLSGTDSALVGLLLDRYPEAISLRELTEALWPTGRPSVAARRTRMMRVRRQLASVDLALRDRPGVGFTLERSMLSSVSA